MTEAPKQETRAALFPNKAVYFLALIFVAAGIINSMPLIPGWDELWRGLTGYQGLKTRSFSTEWFYPIVFLVMMLIVALKHSMWRAWRGTRREWLGVFMDAALVLSSFAISLTYLIEIDSVCLVDRTATDASVVAQQRIFVPVSVVLNRLTLVFQVDRVVAAVGGRPVHQTLVVDLHLLVCVRVASGHGLSLVRQQRLVQNGPVV